MATFAKRHYEVVARILSRVPDDEPRKRFIVDDFVNEFRTDNGNFQPGRFIEACKNK